MATSEWVSAKGRDTAGMATGWCGLTYFEPYDVCMVTGMKIDFEQGIRRRCPFGGRKSRSRRKANRDKLRFKNIFTMNKWHNFSPILYWHLSSNALHMPVNNSTRMHGGRSSIVNSNEQHMQHLVKSWISWFEAWCILFSFFSSSPSHILS